MAFYHSRLTRYSSTHNRNTQPPRSLFITTFPTLFVCYSCVFLPTQISAMDTETRIHVKARGLFDNEGASGSGLNEHGERKSRGSTHSETSGQAVVTEEVSTPQPKTTDWSKWDLGNGQDTSTSKENVPYQWRERKISNPVIKAGQNSEQNAKRPGGWKKWNRTLSRASSQQRRVDGRLGSIRNKEAWQSTDI